MRRVTRTVPPEPGKTPSLISGSASRVPSAPADARAIAWAYWLLTAGN